MWKGRKLGKEKGKKGRREERLGRSMTNKEQKKKRSEREKEKGRGRERKKICNGGKGN